MLLIGMLGLGSARTLASLGEVTSTGAAPTQAPAPPSALEVGAYLGAHLLWAESVGASEYRVYRSADGGGWESIARLSSTRFVDNTLVAGRSYRYRVTSLNSAGFESQPTSESSPVRLAMQIREIEDYNFDGGKYPGFSRAPYAIEAPSSDALDSKYDYFYKFYDYWVPPNPYRPDPMVVSDQDPDPVRTRYVINWTSPGDWWRYTFDVAAEGWVKLALRAATPNVAMVHVFWDEELVTTITCHTGNWGVYDDFPASQVFRTSAGRHTLRLALANAAVDLDLFGFDFSAPPPSRRVIFQENFEAYASSASVAASGGWTIANNSNEPALAWTIQNTSVEPRPGFFSGLEGRYLITDSGENPRGRADETLISPSIDCRGFTRVSLQFASNIKINAKDDSTQNCDLELDTFDEATSEWLNRWTTIFHRDRQNGDAAGSYVLPIASTADGKQIRLRWRFHDAKWDYWWALDDIEVSGEKAEALTIPSVLSLSINGGASITTEREVQIQPIVTGNPVFVMLSERADFVGAQWQPLSQSFSFNLSPDLGPKTIYSKAKNEAGISNPASATITYAPAEPGLRALRTLESPAVFSSGYVDIAVEVSYTGTDPVLGMDLQESLPLGWIFESVVRGPPPASAPAKDAIGTLPFHWDQPPAFPFLFVYRIRFAGAEFMSARLTGEVRIKKAGTSEIATIAGAVSLAEARSDQMFQRVLYHGTVLSTQEWDWIADAGFTLVHSYGGDPFFLRKMMDEAHQRGIKMIAGSWQGQGIPWLRLSLNAASAGAPASLRLDVRHHYSDAHPSLVFFAAPGHPLHMLQVPLENPAWNTIGKLAAYLNSLGYGLSAQVEPGKEAMSSEFLATWQYGDLAQGGASVWGSELPNSYRQYVEVIKDHPALFCFVPFDDVDLMPYSPTFQRYVVERIREWAPGVPVYLLPQGTTPATFQHDHKQEHSSFDGVINYIYPGILPDHVDVLRTEIQNRWAFHAQDGLKPWILLGKGFSFSGESGVPPKGSLILQWEAAKRADVPLTGFGFYGFQHDGGEFAISGVRGLQQECREVNRLIKEEYFDLRIEQDTKRTIDPTGEVRFNARIFGGKGPYLLRWDFGDGENGWGGDVKHRYPRAGEYRVKATCLDSRGAVATRETRVYLTGSMAPLIREDFEQGSSGSFVVHNGTWTVEGGRYTQSSVPADGSWSSISANLGKQYSIETDLAFTAPGGEAWIVWAGAALNANARLTWHVPGDPDFTLKGTSLLELQTDSGVGKVYIAFDRKHVYHVVVDVFADVVAVSVDGAVLIEQSITAMSGDGTVGIGVKNTRAAFDNFTVAPLPGLTASVSLVGPEPAAEPYVVSLAANLVGGQAPFSLHWDFGDGSTSTESNPQHVFASRGAWNVRLQVTDGGGQSASGSRIVMTGPQTYYREAEDYDWTDGSPPGYPTEAEFGIKYGAGQRGRKGVDFYDDASEGDLTAWRDAGQVSLETGRSDTGINIRSAGAIDWWNYTFKFPAPGVARIRAVWAADRTAPARHCRISWKGKPIGDLVIPGNGEENYVTLESAPFPVDSALGQIQFQSLDWGLSFARFEIIYVPATDTDGDGIPDVLDPDSDNDGYMDADELTNRQSDPSNANSRPTDADGDHLSDANDPDDDNDGVPDVLDAAPLVANRAPLVYSFSEQTVRAGEMLSLKVHALDLDLPAQKLSFKLTGDIPPGAVIGDDGVLTWTPTTSQALKDYSLAITVTDTGTPPASTTKVVNVRVNEARTEGFASVTITTTNGPVTLVVPRKEYRFTALNRTLYVATNGSDTNPGTIEQPWRTFAKALPELQPGDVLYVRGGEYAEPFEITKSGTRAKPIAIAAFPGERVRIVQPEGWQDAHPEKATVAITSAVTGQLWFHGFEVEGGWRTGDVMSSGGGRGCISVNGYRQDDNLRIVNNICSKGHDYGIRLQVEAPLGVLLEGNVVWQCGFGSLGTGIFADTGVDARTQGLIIRGNLILNSHGGIALNYVRGSNMCYNNVAALNSTDGNALIIGSAGTTLAHNVWYQNDASGLMFQGRSETNTILNSIWGGITKSHLRWSDGFGVFDGRELSNRLDSCVFDPSSVFASPLEWFTPWIGTNLIHADPLFIDPQHLDFRLQPTSPARNAASPVKLLGALPSPDIGLFSATNYWQPDLLPIPDFHVNEMEELKYQFQLAVTNPAVAELKFELLSGSPDGAYVDARTGLFTWRPSEHQGPGSYTVTVHVTADDSPLLTSIASFGITVQEVNGTPLIGTIRDLELPEGSSLVLNLQNAHVGLSPGLLREVFSALPGASLFDLTNSLKFPNSPDRSELLSTGFEAPRDVADNYGQGLRGYVVPPETGDYTFWIASDDQSVLSLSLDDSPANARSVARVNTWTASREWTKEPNQKSAPIPLVAGQYYYIEAVMKEGGGGDNLAVRWRLPTGALETPIPASRLFPWEKQASFANSFVAGGRPGLRHDVWFSYQSTDTLEAITNSTQVLNSPARSDLLLDYFETPPNTTDNTGLRRWGQRVRGLLIPPQTGDYTFQIAAGGDSVLYLSSDESPQNVKAIASIIGGTERREWNKTPSQQSAPLHLQESKPYYIEAITMADRDKDHLSVGWRLPEGRTEAPIPASRVRLVWDPVLATDPDEPQGKLTFTLASEAPSGMEINRATGRLTWVPAEAQGPGTYQITVRVADNGDPPLSATTTFTVAVREINAPPILPAINDQTATENNPFRFSISASDTDVPVNPLEYSLLSGPPGMSIATTTGMISWAPDETAGGARFPVTVRVTDNGTPPLSDSRAFTVSVAEVNSPPTLAPIVDQTIKAGTPLNFTAGASDLDIPANALMFSLDPGAPAGATINPVTGIFNWTPPTTISALTNVITIRVTDDGVPPLSASQAFMVVLTPSNIAPVLADIPDQTIPEEALFIFQAAASDSDVPQQQLTFSIESAPNGATINPITGEFTWTPTEEQGPGTYRILARVTDDGLPPLTGEKSFTLTVSEVNRAPVLAAIADQKIIESTALVLTNSVSDADQPPNKLAFELVRGPAGMTLDPISGVLNWTPQANHIPSTNQITIKVTDDGDPPLGDTKSFDVIVQRKAASAPPRITSPRLWADGRFSFEFTAEPGRAYTIEASPDLTNWESVVVLPADGQGHGEFSESLPAKLYNRYYRMVEQ